MTDGDCVAFLQWALPTLRLRWEGFRKPRRQVCRRIRARAGELGLDGLIAYRAHLEAHSAEWAVLDRLCRVTISRFYRDRGVWDALRAELDPRRVWSAGCGSGEEAYTAALAWPAATVLATDADATLLERAARGCYAESTLEELPEPLRASGFDGRCIRKDVKRRVTLVRHDIRDEPPDAELDLVLCRNLAFTYFAEPLQLEIGRRLAAVLVEGGALVVGAHEALPEGLAGLEPWLPSTYRRVVEADNSSSSPAPRARKSCAGLSRDSAIRRRGTPGGSECECGTPGPSLARVLREHREEAFARGFAKGTDLVFASATGTGLSDRKSRSGG